MEEKEFINEIEKFHKERISKLKDNETPKSFREGGKIVIHLIPLDSFRNPKDYDLSIFAKEINTFLLPMLVENKEHSQEYNYDGVLDFISGTDDKCLSYVQLYRTGMIEAVEGLFLRPEIVNIDIYQIEQEIILRTEDYISLQKAIGIEPSLIYYLALLGVKGHTMEVNSIDTQALNVHPFDRDDLILPRITIGNFNINAKEILRLSFYRIWNACGYPRSFQYNEKGEFIAK